VHASRVLLTALVLLVAGCGGEPPGAGAPTTGPASDRPSASSGPSELRSTPTVTQAIPITPLYQAGDIDPDLRPLIDLATADLAEMLGVAESQITTHAAVPVLWPDSSLGCPQPGMNYPQVLVDGSIIELEHHGTYYRFHAGGRRDPFQCPTPLTAVPGLSGGGGGRV
jgi:hypothetical protein